MSAGNPIISCSKTAKKNQNTIKCLQNRGEHFKVSSYFGAPALTNAQYPDVLLILKSHNRSSISSGRMLSVQFLELPGPCSRCVPVGDLTVLVSVEVSAMGILFCLLGSEPRRLLKLLSRSRIRRRRASFSCFAASSSDRWYAASSYRAVKMADGRVGDRASIG